MQIFRSLIVLFCSFLLLPPAFAVEKNEQAIRFATFNIAMGLETEGELYLRLQSGEDEALKKAAAIIQRVRPDVLLLNEFDWYELDSALLFIKNYLDTSQYGNQAISYAHAVSGAVNTGLDSGLDLNGNGTRGEAADAWGFGKFPGQYGMLVLSQFPLSLERSFRRFRWRDMPAALVPVNPDGTSWYPPEVFEQLRLSSKSHWDVAVSANGHAFHFLVSHPTPPVFDGPEDRNGARNYDEIRFWADYVDPSRSGYIYDDAGVSGGLAEAAKFIIAGDLNADPVDGDSSGNAIGQLLGHEMIDASCVPLSKGALEASTSQAGKNIEHRGNAAADTGDFNDKYTGNMRIDYVLPSAGLKILGCGVFWPGVEEEGQDLIDFTDHRLVWLDIDPG